MQGMTTTVQPRDSLQRFAEKPHSTPEAELGFQHPDDALYAPYELTDAEKDAYFDRPMPEDNGAAPLFPENARAPF
jgi:hypothetical protein